jgi:hypothetical protein
MMSWQCGGGGCHLLIVSFGWLFIGMLIALAVHEAGHLICARAMGIPVRQVTVGTGPLLFGRRFGETRLELRLFPTGGYVLHYPATLVHRGRRALVLSGGVLANATAIAAIFTGWNEVPALADDVIVPIVFMQVWIIFVNLLPRTVRVGDIRIGSDGLQLLELRSMASGEPTAAGKHYLQLIANYADGGAPPLTGASSRVMYQVARIDRWADSAAGREPVEALPREPVEALLRELQPGILSAAEEAFIIDLLLTHALARGDKFLRPRLDALSQRALTLAPSATLSGSRGAALVEIGRYAEGKAILETLITGDGLSEFDIFMTEVHLARAEQGLGNRDAAARWAAAARRSAEVYSTPTTPMMLARMDVELAADQDGDPPQSDARK